MIKIPFIKVSAIIFVLLAMPISLFPPFYFYNGKQYDFIFRVITYRRAILFGELIVEYILAFLISVISGYLIQRFIQRKTRKSDFNILQIPNRKESEIKFSSGVLDAIAKMGKSYFKQGSITYSAWSQEMIWKFGDEIRPYLKDMYDEINVNFYKTNKEEKSQESNTSNKSLNLTGIDAEIMKSLSTIGAYHIENGLLKFADWSMEMAKEIPDWLKDTIDLKKLWDKVKGENPEFFR